MTNPLRSVSWPVEISSRCFFCVEFVAGSRNNSSEQSYFNDFSKPMVSFFKKNPTHRYGFDKAVSQAEKITCFSFQFVY